MIVKIFDWFLDRAAEVFRKYVLSNGPSHDELMERARADVDRLDTEINLQGLSRATVHCAIFNAQDEYRLDEDLWSEFTVFEFPPVEGISKIGKAQVLKNIDNPLQSFKFYLRVQNEREQIERARKLLLDNKMIVTGAGELEGNEQFHRIWFLHPNGHLHPKQTRLDLANHAVTKILDSNSR